MITQMRCRGLPLQLSGEHLSHPFSQDSPTDVPGQRQGAIRSQPQ